MVYRAEIAQRRGAWPQALEQARLAAERCERGSEADGAAEAAYQQGEIHRLRGAFAEAELAYREAGRLGRDPQPGLGQLRLAQGRRGTAVAGLRRALREQQERTRRVRILPALIEALLAGGELDAARAALDELERTSRDYQGSALTTVAAHARGAVELAAGDAPAALAALRSAWRGWQALEAPYEAARTRELVARACEVLQDAETAALELEAARDGYRDLGATVDLHRLEKMDASVAGLTARELEVLRLVAAGSSNKAIAGELGVSDRTVERHLSNIFDKLEVSSRSAATAYAFEHGLA
jgi:DNA-binding NarL/FixJ family response regulator